jgi:hypothetical protein
LEGIFLGDLYVPGTANAFSFFGFAFELMTPTFGENERIRGTNAGKNSLDPLELGDNGDTDNAACTGGINSDSSTLPFHGLTSKELPRMSENL